MLVHLVASRGSITENIKHLRHLIEAIHAEGHSIVRDWVEPTFINVKKNDGYNQINWSTVHKDSLEAINKADIIIADTTIPSFSVGYQVAMAVQMKKPTLVLNRAGVDDSPFSSGIDAGIIYKEYTDKNIKSIIKKFLAENDIQSKDMRFNFFIDRPIYNYLRWASYKTGKTKAEILRELVSREIEKAERVD